MKKLLSTFTFILLTSSTAHASDKTVSIKEVYTKNAGMIECLEYDAASDTCSALSTSAIKGDVISTSSSFLMDLDPKTTLIMKSSFQIKNDMGCTDYSDLKLKIEGTDDKEMIDIITNAMKTSLTGMGTSCLGLIANDDGTYIVRTFDSNHKAVPGQPDTKLTFIKGKKELRMPQ